MYLKMTSLEDAPDLTLEINKPLYLVLRKEIILKTPLGTPRRPVRGNESDCTKPPEGMKAFKKLLHEMTNEEYSPNVIGRLAIGLVRGHIDDATVPTGLYGGIEDIEERKHIIAIGFFDPVILHDRWEEPSVGPKIKLAMKSIIDNLY